MGQQQLLLLVLGIVIVGLAVVVGIQAFGENQSKSNLDAMTNDGIRMASDAQAWALKPQAFGGGEGNFCSNSDAASTDDVQVTLALLGVDATNVNGTYALAGDCDAITITGTSATGAGTVVVTVAGTDADDISTAVTPS